MSKSLKELLVITNGSHKGLEWWSEVFDIASDNGNVTFRFGLDGLPSESRNYRVNQRSEEVWEVMKLGAAKGIDIVWQYIPFRYNEDHISQAEQMAADHGIRFQLKRSYRHPEGERPSESLTIPLNRHISHYPKRKKGEPYSYDDLDETLLSEAQMHSSITSLEPKCIQGSMVPSYTGSGVFLPCCMCGNGDKGDLLTNDPYFVDNGFFDINIDDVDDLVTEVFQTQPWLDFFDLLQNDPLNAPACCKRKCGNVSS